MKTKKHKEYQIACIYFSGENRTQIGVVNPTYESENLNNEARYPHLSARARPNPLPLPTTTKGLESSCDRRTSGCYEDLDEDRYTSLKALENQQSFDEGAYQEPVDGMNDSPSSFIYSHILVQNSQS